MLNKDIFVYKCSQKGIPEEAALKLFKKASKPKSKSKPKTKKKALPKLDYTEGMSKKAFDVGFSDAMRLFAKLNT